MKDSLSIGCSGRCVPVVLLLMLLLPAAYSQSSTGSVRGTVRDQSQAAVPKASVTLTNIATNVSSKSKTNETGFYVFPGLTPGPYHIEVELPGMQKYEATLTVQVQESTTADAVLRVASEAVTISVQDITP